MAVHRRAEARSQQRFRILVTKRGSRLMTIQAITPFLWYEREAEEAANFYVSLFDNSRITHVSRYGDTGPGPKGAVMVVGF